MIAALRQLLGAADPAARSDFVAASVRPAGGRAESAGLESAVLSAAFYPSANAAAEALGVSAHTLADRRRRAARAAALDADQPADRLLLLLGVLVRSGRS